MVPALLGVIAGLITTVAGMGGGLVLLLSLAALYDPLYALAVTAPALLLGNAHRAWLYREHADGGLALRLIVGAIPGSVLGGLLAVELPETVLRIGMVAMAGMAVAKQLGGLRWSPPVSAAPLVGAVVGVLTATAGGGGLLLAPLLLTLNLSGTRYVGTVAMVAVSLHLGRLTAYGLAGATDASTWLTGVALAGTILLGNLLGHQFRRGMTARHEPWVQVGAMGLCVVASLVGLAA